MAELVATYRDPHDARKAITTLERHGVDASRIHLVDTPGILTPKTGAAQNEPDMAVTREVGRRSAVASFVAAVVVGGVAAVVAWVVSDGDGLAITMGALGGFIAGGLLGMLDGGYSGLAVSDEWGESFEATGPATVTVDVTDGDDVIDLRHRLESTAPDRVTLA